MAKWLNEKELDVPDGLRIHRMGQWLHVTDNETGASGWEYVPQCLEVAGNRLESGITPSSDKEQ